MKRCKCGKSTHLKHLRDPLTRAREFVCYPCLKDRFPDGASVVMFEDYTKRDQHYIWIREERDIEELIRVGEWAQAKGMNAVGVYIYYRWRETKNIGPLSFNMGHEGSYESVLRIAQQFLLKHEMGEIISRFQAGMIQQRLSV